MKECKCTSTCSALRVLTRQRVFSSRRVQHEVTSTPHGRSQKSALSTEVFGRPTVRREMKTFQSQVADQSTAEESKYKQPERQQTEGKVVM